MSTPHESAPAARKGKTGLIIGVVVAVLVAAGVVTYFVVSGKNGDTANGSSTGQQSGTNGNAPGATTSSRAPLPGEAGNVQQLAAQYAKALQDKDSDAAGKLKCNGDGNIAKMMPGAYTKIVVSSDPEIRGEQAAVRIRMDLGGGATGTSEGQIAFAHKDGKWCVERP